MFANVVICFAAMACVDASVSFLARPASLWWIELGRRGMGVWGGAPASTYSHSHSGGFLNLQVEWLCSMPQPGLPAKT